MNKVLTSSPETIAQDLAKAGVTTQQSLIVGVLSKGDKAKLQKLQQRMKDSLNSGEPIPQNIVVGRILLGV